MPGVVRSESPQSWIQTIDTGPVRTYYVPMANLTLSIDEDLLRKGRDYAADRGTSLNGLVRSLLTELTTRSDSEISEMMERLRSSPGDSKGIPFNRDDLYEGRV